MHPVRFRILIQALLITIFILVGWRVTINHQTEKLYDHNVNALNQFRLDQSAVAQDMCQSYFDSHTIFADGVDNHLEFVGIDDDESIGIKVIPETTEEIKYVAENMYIQWKARLWMDSFLAYNVSCGYSIRLSEVIFLEFDEIEYPADYPKEVPNFDEQMYIDWDAKP